MATIAHLVVKIGADMADLERNVQKSTKVVKRLGDNLTDVGKKMTIGISVPLAAAGVALSKLGMDAVESENLFEVSFGNMSTAARDWSKTTSESLGLNQFELRRTSATLFTMMESMGLARGEAFNMATGMTTLAHDMASFFNLHPDEAFEKLRAGITGEAEPLKRLGILINETTVKQVAYNAGIAQHGSKLTEVQKVQARYLAIMQQTSKAQGDLARTLDSPTNKLRSLVARLTEAATELGIALLPALNQLISVGLALVPVITTVVDWFTKLPPNVQMTAIAVTALVAAMGPLLVVVGIAVKNVAALGATSLGTSGSVGILRTAMTTLKGAIASLGPAIAVVTTAMAAWEFGKWIGETTGWTTAIERLAGRMMGLSEAEIQAGIAGRLQAEAMKTVTTETEALIGALPAASGAFNLMAEAGSKALDGITLKARTATAAILNLIQTQGLVGGTQPGFGTGFNPATAGGPPQIGIPGSLGPFTGQFPEGPVFNNVPGLQSPENPFVGMNTSGARPITFAPSQRLMQSGSVTVNVNAANSFYNTPSDRARLGRVVGDAVMTKARGSGTRFPTN